MRRVPVLLDEGAEGRGIVSGAADEVAEPGHRVHDVAGDEDGQDVLEVARHIQQGVGPLVGCTCTDELSLVPMDNLKTKYYIRFAVADRSGVLAAMAQVFANHNVSVYSVVQRGKQDGNTVNITYVTHLAREKSVRAVLADIAQLDDVLREEPSVIRVEE